MFFKKYEVRWMTSGPGWFDTTFEYGQDLPRIGDFIHIREIIRTASFEVYGSYTVTSVTREHRERTITIVLRKVC